MSRLSVGAAGAIIDALFFLVPDREPRFRARFLLVILLVGVIAQGLLLLAHAPLSFHLVAVTLTYLLGQVYCFRPAVWVFRHLRRAGR